MVYLLFGTFHAIINYLQIKNANYYMSGLLLINLWAPNMTKHIKPTTMNHFQIILNKNKKYLTGILL